MSAMVPQATASAARSGAWASMPVTELLRTYPELVGFFQSRDLAIPETETTFSDWARSLDDNDLDARALDRDDLCEAFARYLADIEAMHGEKDRRVEHLSLAGGVGKDGKTRDAELEVEAGEVICLVGPTGSGKSRLLCDIECLAQGDTPSGRRVCIDGRAPTDEERFSSGRKLVAQLSQGMNYVLDLEVSEFIEMHAMSRNEADPERVATKVIAAANTLCGEPFDGGEPTCLLSGGQSRALMIADVALLSRSPIVLIDELENAGVDKHAALDLLVQEGKMVLIATHDPLLMLLGSRRVAMRGGCIERVVDRSTAELDVLDTLEAYETRVEALRNRLRDGETIDAPVELSPYKMEKSGEQR